MITIGYRENAKNTTKKLERGYNMSIGHRDTANFKKYHSMKKEEENHFDEITDDDIDRLLEEF